MIDLETINERILYIIEIKADGNQKKFAETIGVMPQVINNIVSGRKSKPSFDVLKSIISTYVDLNPEWLLTGKGSMLKQKLNIIGNQKSAEATMDIQDIPLYNLEATAGLVELFRSEKVTSVLDSIRIPGIPKCDGGLSITGDSMYPLLKSGDIVLYKEIPVEQQSIFFGEMYLLGVRVDEWEEMITVKYVQKSEKGEEYVKLVSQNQYHHPKDVLLSNITAMAIIKASIRFNTMF